MAIVTGIAARDVILGLSKRHVIIVAAGAVTHDLQVIDAYHRLKCRGRVAVLADVGRRNMILRLAD